MPVRMLASVLSALVLSSFAIPAWSQQAQLAPSEALRCLTPSADERAALTYPPKSLATKEEGLVRAELTFDGPDQPPEIRILSPAPQALEIAVTDHLRQYRVPCLPAGEKAVLRQSFNFVAVHGGRVHWTNMGDTGDSERQRQLECLEQPKSLPHYPPAAIRREREGVVALDLKFRSATSAPEIVLLDDTPDKLLVQSARDYAEAMRLPCHAGAPVMMSMHFHFSIEARRILKDMPLVKYLAGLKDIKKAQVHFDFTQMGCPFDLRVVMYQPIWRNRIGEIGVSNPARAFFIDWLSRQQVVATREQANLMLGLATTVSVPCGTLTLGNTQGGTGSQ